MPQLPSGLRVALSVSPYQDALLVDNENSAYYAVLALLFHASTPEDLLRQAVVGVIPEGLPDTGPAYRSGYCVVDVLEGRSDWSSDDIGAFREFLGTERVQAWLQQEFDALMKAVQEHPVWQSPLCEGFDDTERIDAAALKRAVICRTVQDPASMAELRRLRDPH